MKKRVQAWIMALVMLFTTVAVPLMGAESVKAAEEPELKIQFHYLREDGDYTDWDIFAWGGAEGCAFQTDEDGFVTDENGAVAEAVVKPGSKEVGFIVRKTDWSDREWVTEDHSKDGNRAVDVDGWLSGTIHAYVVQGSFETVVDYSEAVEGEYVPPAKTKSVFIHYLREDGNYTDWGVHAWGIDGDTTKDANDFMVDEDGNLIIDENGVVSEIKVVSEASEVGFIVRKADWSDREWVDQAADESNRFINVSEYASGEIHVYVKQGVVDIEVDYSRAQKPPVVINFLLEGEKPDKNIGLWLWDDVGTDAIYPIFEEQTEDGAYIISYEVAPAASWVGFIVRDDDWGKYPDGDRQVDVSSIVGGVVNVTLTINEEEFEVDDTNAIKGAKVIKAVYEDDTIVVTTSLPLEVFEGVFKVLCEDEEVEIASVVAGEKENTYVISFENGLNPTKAYKVLFGGNMYKVSMPSLYTDEEWIAENTYEGKDLGATWTEEKTTFKVWAPLASEVSVNLYVPASTISLY